MKLRQFQYLAAIQTHGSMAKAAQALFVSQPAISRDIRALEAELGFPILQRSWQGAVFTPQGRQVLEIAQAILGEVEKLRQLAGGSGAAIWGRLALGGTAYFSHSLLLGAVVSLHQRYPQLDIRLEEDHSRAVLDRLHDGSLDLGVILHCNLD